MNHSLLLKTCVLLYTLMLTGCSYDQHSQIFLPASMLGKVDVVASCNQNCTQEILENAIASEGKGGISSGILVRLTDDMDIYRMWNGPRINEYGTSNRIGAWWTAERPSGKAKDYRIKNAVCEDWNDLTWVAKCKLKKGSLVAVGPTQSANCGKSGENYSANNTQQLYVDNYSPQHIQCEKYKATDYEVNPDDIYLKK